MTDIYFGAKTPQTTNNGNWADVGQWYATLGDEGSKYTGPTPGTLLNRLPNPVTDNIILYQSVVSNVGTYTGTISSPYNASIADSLAIYSGKVSVDASIIYGGAFADLFVQSGVTIFGGTFDVITGNGVTINSDGLAGIKAATLVGVTGTVTINLTRDALSTVALQIGSYSAPCVNLLIAGAFILARPIILFCRTKYQSTFTDVTLTGVITNSPSVNGLGTFIITNAKYQPTVSVPLIFSNGVYKVDDANMPANLGFGIEGGTFLPTIKLTNLPPLTSNIGAILE